MIGTKVGGRYLVTDRLGGGGFGLTYLARNLDLPDNPLCVVKQLKPQSDDPETLRVAKRLFDQEAEVLSRLGSHDRIPELLDHFEEDGVFFLVQEFIEGDSLDKELCNNGRFSQQQVITLLREVLEVLAFVHRQGVIHRDIKPANLVRRKEDGRIVLIDFGAVKQIGATASAGLTQSSMTVAVGSFGYMPSEQIAGRPHFSSDIYGLGIVCIQALTGATPDQFRQGALSGELVWQDRAQVSPQLANVLNRCVRYDYRQRFFSAAEALRELTFIAPPASEGAQLPPTVIDNPGAFAQPGRHPSGSRPKALEPTGIIPQKPPSHSRAKVGPGRANPIFSKWGIYSIIVGVLAIASLSAYVYGWFESQKESAGKPATYPVAERAKDQWGKPGRNTTDPNRSFELGELQAVEAVLKSHEASTREDWKDVSVSWGNAVDFMKDVPKGHEKYNQAQQKIAEYEQQRQLALAKADQPPPSEVIAAPPTIPAPIIPEARPDRTYFSINTYDITKGNNPRVFTPENGFFDAYVGRGPDNGSITVRFKGPKDYFDLSLAGPNGAALSRGEYLSAQRWPFHKDGRPGLSFSGNSSGCNKLSGRFTINEISFWSDGELGYLDVKFEQRCEGSTTVTYGLLRYDRRDQR